MLADLKRELGRLVVQAEDAVTGKILTPEDQRRLDEETAAATCSLGKANSDHEHDEESRRCAKLGENSASVS